MLNRSLFSLLLILYSVGVKAQQSDSISIHIQLIPITDSAALVRCHKMASPFSNEKRVPPNKSLDCRISFETAAKDTGWVSVLWCAFDREYYYAKHKEVLNIDTERNGTSLKEFIDTLRYALVILENLDGEFRILYGRRGEYDRRLSRYEEMKSCAGITHSSCNDIYLLPSGVYRYKDEHWLSPLIKDIFYTARIYEPHALNRLQGFCGYPSVLFSFDDLRVKKGDTSCRMHYVYVSSTSNPKLERIRRVYTSNWFPLNEE